MTTTRTRAPRDKGPSTKLEAEGASAERYQSQLLEAALDYARRGFDILPVGPNKKPHVRGGYKAARRKEALIRHWWAKWPDANIGIVTGKGLMVLDPDDHGGLTTGTDALAALGPLPRTPVVKTPQGRHVWFLGDGPTRKVAPGLDLKGRGGYVLVPPSRTEFGTYDWRVDLDEASLAPLPALPSAQTTRLRAEARPGSVTAQGDTRSRESGDVDGPIHEGDRHDSLVHRAVQLRYQGTGFEEILADIRSMNEGRCMPPKGDEEVVAIAGWAATCPILPGGIGRVLTGLEAKWQRSQSPGRAGVTDQVVMRAVLEVARKAGRVHGLHLPVRSFPGVRRDTASRSLRRLLNAGHLARSSRKSRWLAQAFDLVLPEEPLSTEPDSEFNSRLQGGLAQFAFGGRENARRILAALEEGPKTSRNLSDQLVINPRTVAYNLRWLKGQHLARGPRKRGGRWESSGTPSFDTILRIGLAQGTLDGFIQRMLRADQERLAADVYVRDRVGVDRATGEVIHPSEPPGLSAH
jgi:DNA-binding transcriptional ArsR family regulator